MKISQLIKILAEYQIEHGDLEVYWEYWDGYTKAEALDEILEMEIEAKEGRLVFTPTATGEIK